MPRSRSYDSRSRSRSRSRSYHRRRRHHRSRSRTPSPVRDPTKSPQEVLAEFWTRFHAEKQGKVTSIFPRSLYASLLPGSSVKDDSPRPDPAAAVARNAAESYEAAAAECRERVRSAVAECRRTNEKFTDPDFDVDSDSMDNCLYGLERGWDFFIFGSKDNRGRQPRGAPGRRDADEQQQVPGRGRAREGAWQRRAPVEDATQARSGSRGVGCGFMMGPSSIHRVDWIFENPQFTVNGYSSSDIKQGRNGDCWWLAAVATIAHRRDLMERVCVARDEECGVYGFCFFRDGEWVPAIVDDNLYLTREDFDQYGDVYDPSGRRALRHRQRYQTGSEALYFARCDDPNETWLPLLEKAYAKAHCDYAAIEGGWSSEGVEDMTGGVGTTIASSKILSKDKLWRELATSDSDFVFALSAMGTGWDRTRNGLALGHAYSVLQATEALDEDGKRIRLVKIRNPWGERDAYGLGEWTGPWSDGSKEWTPYWLRKLSHTFGDDGVFWMSFDDMLSTFKWIHRTRLFDSRWTVVSAWTSAAISWVTGFLRKKFRVEIKKAGTVVVVLTQLDDRYFVGLEGQYYFELHFVLQRAGGEKGEHVCRARQVHKWENRSISCEVELEAGVYEVIPKVTASRRYGGKVVEDVVRDFADENPQKVRQVGLQYDLAHAKPGVSDYDLDLEAEKDKKKKKEESKKAKEKAKKKKESEAQKKAVKTARKENKKMKVRRRKDVARARRAMEKDISRAKKRNEERQKRREAKELEKVKEKEDAARVEDAVEAGVEVGAEAQKPEESVVEDPKIGGSKADESKASDALKESEPVEAEASPEKKADEQPAGEKPTSDASWTEVSKETPAQSPETLILEVPAAAPESNALDAAAEPETKTRPFSPAPEDSATDGSISSDEDVLSIPSYSSPSPSSSDSDSSFSSESESEDEDPKKDDLPHPPPARSGAPPPWNPVCVMGLRVYALDPEVSVALVEVSGDEEGASLTTDGEPAGATS